MGQYLHYKVLFISLWKRSETQSLFVLSTSAFTIADNTNFGLDNSPYNDQRNLCCVPESILSVGADSSYASLVNGRLCINVRFEKYGTNLRTLLVITAVHVEDNDWNLSL